MVAIVSECGEGVSKCRRGGGLTDMGRKSKKAKSAKTEIKHLLPQRLSHGHVG